MNSLAHKLNIVDIKSDGLWMYNESILKNYMGGYFPIESLNRYSESVGNNGKLTFNQIVDFFDVHFSDDSNHNTGIYVAISLSDYMEDEHGSLDKAKKILDGYRCKMGDAHTGNKDNLYYAAILFRDAYVESLKAHATIKYGAHSPDMVYMINSEIKQLKNVATNIVKRVVQWQISQPILIDGFVTQVLK